MLPDYKAFFAGKRVTMLGLGLLGRGVGDARFLATCGAQVLVTDKKTSEELAASLEQIADVPNISLRLGEHRLDDFTGCDMVIKAAGVPLDSPYTAAACEAGIPVYMSTALFAAFARARGATIVGVTGTRGKSTTTHMIHHVLTRTATNRRIFLGGNVRGVSTLAMLPEVRAGDIAVLELDSWQLQGFGTLALSPQVSVFTNLMPDHQNYYPSMDAYFSDKANIFRFQKQGDTLVCGSEILARIHAAQPPCAPHVPNALPDTMQLRVEGAHNRDNAALACGALRALGVSDAAVAEHLGTFLGVEGRLQYVGEVRGARIYNDNNATTPDATMAALHALGLEKKNIVLIMGGSDKGLDMSRMLYEVARVCKRVLLLAGTGTARITPYMRDFSLFDSLEAAVHEALSSAMPGDVVLFSPAFASFGMFKNEYDRNDQFMALIQKASGKSLTPRA